MDDRTQFLAGVLTRAQAAGFDGSLADYAAHLEAERDRLREALERIADPTCMVVDGYIDTEVPSRIAAAALQEEQP